MTKPATSPMLSATKQKRCRLAMRKLLAPGEELIALADITSVAPSTIGLAVTDQRIVGIPKEKTLVELQISKSELAGIRFDKRLVFSYLVGSTTDGRELEFGIALSEEREFLKPFLDRLLTPSSPLPTERAVQGQSPPAPPPPAPPPLPTSPEPSGISLVKQSRPQPTAAANGPTVADELVKLADLHDRGFLTAEEFAAAKTALLRQLS